MANPTGKNQYSGGGKGGKLVHFKQPTAFGHGVKSATRDDVARAIKMNRATNRKYGGDKGFLRSQINAIRGK